MTATTAAARHSLSIADTGTKGSLLTGWHLAGSIVRTRKVGTIHFRLLVTARYENVTGVTNAPNKGAGADPTRVGRRRALIWTKKGFKFHLLNL